MAGDAALPPRPARGRDADPAAHGTRRDIPVAVRDRHQQRGPDRAPRRRPLALGEPHLRRGLRQRAGGGPAQVRIPELPPLPGRRLAALRLGLPAPGGAHPGPDHVLLSRQLHRARALRRGITALGPGSTGRSGQPGPAGRLHRSPRARHSRPRLGRRGPSPRPLLPRHPHRGGGLAPGPPGRMAWRLHPDHGRTGAPPRLPRPGVRGPRPLTRTRQPARSPHPRRRIAHRPLRPASPQTRLALHSKIRIHRNAS
jgi:hypothetical protein